MRALLRGAHISGVVRLWSRHATPRAFTHLIVQGPTGRAILGAIDPAAPGLFVVGHPTLGDWSRVPALCKRPDDGGVLHAFAGMTPDDGGSPLTVAEFAALDAVELYVAGHLRRYVNGRDRLGVPILGLDLTDATLLDAIDPAVVVWRSDSGEPWALVPVRYKRADGRPRVDPDDVHDTAVVQWTDDAEVVLP